LNPENNVRFIDGKDIRHIRVDLDLSQAALAKAMGVAPATLSRIKQNLTTISRPYY
jgi:transcriptional regulator with XRE-family HTH domain